VVWCEVSSGVFRPLVPPSLRRCIFEQIHGLAHAGTRATTRLISSRFVWEGLASQVKAWCQDCTRCYTAKITTQEVAPVEQIPIPQRKFSHVHVDLVGPWPISEGGYTHVLTAIDRTTRWPEACPLRGTTAEEVLENFISTWVSRFGVPEIITTDKGVQFTSATWQSWCKQHNVRHILTTAYHPQSNGMVERLHRQIKQGLRARGAAVAWAGHLPWVMLAIRATPKDSCNVSAGEATLGQQLAVPGQLIISGPSVSNHHAIPPTWHVPEVEASSSSSSPLEMASWVYIKRGGSQPPLSESYLGPFEVMERGAKVFRIKVGEKVEGVSRDRLKPHRGSAPLQPALPAKRGRPPGDRRQ